MTLRRIKGSVQGSGSATSLGIASVMAVTGAALLASEAGAQAAPGLAGVQSFAVGPDGVLNLLLENGQQLLIEAGQFSVGANGAIVLTEAALAQLAQALIIPAIAVPGVALGAAAAVGVAVAQGQDEQGQTETQATPATIGGVFTGSVTEDSDKILTTSGTLTVTDPDAGQAVFVAQTSTAGTYGTFTLASSGAWVYVAAEDETAYDAIQRLGAGQTLTDSFTAVTADGTTQTVTVTINGANDPARIGGAITGSVTEDTALTEGTLTANGTLTVSDRDTGQAVFVAQPNAAGTYGSFTLATNGAWTYTANNGQTAIQNLGPNNSLTDSFTATTADGTAQVVTVTINGTAEPIAAVQLSAVETGLGGFVINGVSANDNSGWSVSNAGDVNGDGLDDLIVGAPLVDTSGNFAGASFVVFGKTTGTAVELSAIALGNGGFVINGVTEFDQAGKSVSAAGDVNGDGLADLIVGAYSRDANDYDFGASYVVFGKTDGAPVSLQNIEGGEGGFAIRGVSPHDRSGGSVSTAGDVNGDGLDDLIVGATGVGNYIGASYVVFGKANSTAVNLSTLGDGGFVINGVTEYGVSGSSVSGAGDVNGDGLDDLIVGAIGENQNGENSGASYVVFGKTSATAVQLRDIEGGEGNGFVIKGGSAEDNSGYSVSTAGDVNGDGLDDLIIGARQAGANGSFSGASYVVFGKANRTAVELSAMDNGGFVINGISGERSGFSVSSAGDVNGDGLDDLIIGAPYSSGASPTGSSYVVFGKSSNTAVELSTIATGDGGFVIRGAVPASFNDVSGNDFAGRSVSAAGDVNGDGFADLIIGAPYDDPNLPIGGDPNNQGAAGASFVVFGGDFSKLATQIGTTGFDYITGTAGADNVIAGTGNDIVLGFGGADVLLGGAGNDLLGVSDLTFARVDGGTGVDTLMLSGGGLTLDLTTLDNTSLNGIERINLNGSNNALVLNKLEVLRLSDTTNTLRVMGFSNNRLTITDSGWVKGNMLVESPFAYEVYTNGNARLEVDLNVQILGLPIPAVQLSAVEQGIGGFVMNGTTSDGRAGTSVSTAGDLNGDGFDDLIVGALGANGGVSASYVVFGKSIGDAVQLSSLGAGGVVISGMLGADSGRSVSNAGDVNGDGIEDLIIGAPFADPNGTNSGTAYVVFGKSDNMAVSLQNIEGGEGGFVINGATSSNQIGRVVSSAGDVNGDGFDDLIVANQGANRYTGQTYVVFGDSAPTAVNLSSLGTKGFVINGGTEYDYSGTSVSNAGDVNGDGLDDVLVSAFGVGDYVGAAYVVFGKRDDTTVQLTNLGSGGFVINGASSSDMLGNNPTSVSNAGDVNGDGFDDLIVAASGADPNGRTNAGVSYVVFGKANTTSVNLANLGTGGFVINGVSRDDHSGYSVSTAGDVNGDGLDDLIIGAPNADPNGPDSGASYVVFGKADHGLVELSAVQAGIGGFVINGVTGVQPPNSWIRGDNAGYAVSTAGDVNGDGFDDLIVGAKEDDPNGLSSGASFVVFGGNLTGAVTQLGRDGGDHLTGTTAGDVIFGARGNDRLDGGGGIDRLSGGSGADTFVVRDLAGTTTIIDYTDTIGTSQDDRLDVSAFGFADFAEFTETLAVYGQGGHDLRATLDNDTFIIFQGIGLSDLSASNVILTSPPDVG